MGKFVKTLMRHLRDGNASFVVPEVEEALRFSRIRNYRSGFVVELDAEGVTDTEAVALRKVVYWAYEREPNPRTKNDLMLILARDGDKRVKLAVEHELARAFWCLSEASGDIWQAVLALEGLGVNLRPAGVSSFGYDFYDLNARMATDYLKRRRFFRAPRVRKVSQDPGRGKKSQNRKP